MQPSSQLVHAELERLSLQQTLIKQNEVAGQQTGNDIKKLDASVKRNTTLIKRLRNITEDSVVSLLDDIARTNQSKVIDKKMDQIAATPYDTLYVKRYTAMAGDQ